jgi:penicillin-insensitive murein endopeptidase
MSTTSSSRYAARMALSAKRLALGTLTVACLTWQPQPSGADETKTLVAWHTVRKPAAGPAQSIGGYSAGCIRGAQSLPVDGKHHRVMRPSRHRHFGHPALIDYIRDVSRQAKKAGLPALLLGDLGQPRGGPAPSGHSSHQTGLDVDIWYRAPAQASVARLDPRERAQLHAPSVVDHEQNTLNDHWSPAIGQLLRLSASDARVARIFVHPVIKQELCRSTTGDRSFLAKLRPWYGHDDHFHVRLDCPQDSTRCQRQAAPAAGDGCEELAYWFSDEAKEARRKGRKRYQSTVGAKPTLPLGCGEVLAENAAASEAGPSLASTADDPKDR